MRSHKHALAAVLLLLCLFVQAMGHVRSASITFDEGPHLAVGYATLRSGDLRLQPVHIHPPLANALAAAPLLLQNDLPDPRSVGGWEIASLSAISDAIVWQYPHPDRLAMATRFPIVLMTLLLGAVVYRWASDLFGPRAGLLALGLYAFDPNIIAHGSLVTTDMAVVLWGTMALFLTSRYLHRSRRRYLVGAGLALGLALASKVSAISLLPALGLLWLLGPRCATWPKRFLRTAGTLTVAFAILWAAYGFEVRPLPGLPFPIPAATHVAIYRSLQEHYELGHPAFLLGQNADHGWWYYFPVAFVLKTPLPTLILLALAASLQVNRFANLRITNPQTHRSQMLRIADSLIRRWGPLALYPLLYAASTPLSSVNIGYRHLLPILPFLFIFISQTCPERRTTGSRRRVANHVSRITYHVLRFTLYALIAWYVITTLRIFPHYLAYFNLLAGGPRGGYRALVDSNLDWGQNLWQLREWMGKNNVERVYYAHFSPDRPSVYGIDADFLPPDPRAVDFAPLDPAPGVYAIGATVLQGVYTPDVNTYAWFRAHDPVTRLGHALFIYRVPPRPELTWVAVCADPAPTLPPEIVRASLGRPDMRATLRTILLDCEGSWVYPAGGEPGVYVLPPEIEPPPDATLEVAARHAAGRPFYAVYRIESPSPAPQQPRTVSLDGPLTFLGFQIDQAAVHPGETLVLQSFWKVEETPQRLLSLMAHLVGTDGIPIAVGDGLGVTIEQWQPGDVIVQRHRLDIPEDTPAGEYHLVTGGYWLDTMERWATQDEAGNLSSSIDLTTVEVQR